MKIFSVVNCIHIQCTALCPSWEFKNNLEKLTKSQFNVINYVKKAYEEKQLPFHLFITGGEGDGKTFTTKILMSYYSYFALPN